MSAAVAGMCSFAAADQPPAAPPVDTAKEIQALRDRIDQLEKQQKEQEQKQQEATTVDSVLNDASKHSQFLDSTGISAGWNPSKQQFFIGSDDGKFYLHPGIIFQVRGV